MPDACGASRRYASGPGGLATAVVAALIFVGTLLVNGLLGASVLSPEGSWRFSALGMTAYAALAAFGALAATGLLHLLLPNTPRPLHFFSWIVGLAVAGATVAPFAQDGPVVVTVATSLLTWPWAAPSCRCSAAWARWPTRNSAAGRLRAHRSGRADPSPVAPPSPCRLGDVE